jgi:hypothetical protein
MEATMSDRLATVPAKPRRIPHKVRAAVAAMVSGECKTITSAAEKVGLSREHLSRQLSEPHITEFMHQKVRRSLALAAARAGATKIDLLDCESLHVRNDASEFILALAGIKPATGPSVSVNVAVTAGYVIDLSDHPKPAQRLTIEGESTLIAPSNR